MKKFHSNGQIKSIYYKKQRVWHNNDGPARMEFYPTGQIRAIEYWHNGVRHNEYGHAAHYVYCGRVNAVYSELHGIKNSRKGSNIEVRKEYWQGGKRHRIGGAAVIILINGAVIREEYWQNGELHRADGPAILFKIGKLVIKEEYWQSGKQHRIGAPAVISNRPYIKCEHYYVNGVPHRVGAPALNEWHRDGSKRKEYWCDCGNEDYPNRTDIYWKPNGEVRRWRGGGANIDEFEKIIGTGNCRDCDYVEIYPRSRKIPYIPWTEGIYVYKPSYHPYAVVYDGNSATVRGVWSRRHYLIIKEGDKMRALRHNISGPEISRKGNARYYIMGEKLSEEEWRQRIFPPAIKEQIYILPQPIAEEICEYFTAMHGVP
jgi:hypothetical protein